MCLSIPSDFYLITRQRIAFNIISNEKINHQEIRMIISRTFIFISTGIFSTIILFIIIIFIYSIVVIAVNYREKKSLSNLLTATPDSLLIDNEYVRI